MRLPNLDDPIKAGDWIATIDPLPYRFSEFRRLKLLYVEKATKSRVYFLDKSTSIPISRVGVWREFPKVSGRYSRLTPELITAHKFCAKAAYVEDTLRDILDGEYLTRDHELLDLFREFLLTHNINEFQVCNSNSKHIPLSEWSRLCESSESED